MADPFPIRRLDHLELYVGNARQAAAYYPHAFGFRATAYRGLETGCREATSYVLECREIRLVLTSGLAPGHAAARFAHAHGDGVAVLALEVPDAFRGFAEACRRGAAAAGEPVEERDEHGALRSAAIRAYGDTVIRFVERAGYRGAFAPGFEARGGNGPPAGAVGLAAVDHVEPNVERGQMNRWVRFFAETMGFSELLHFDDEAISTEYSALMSKVMQDGTGRAASSSPSTSRDPAAGSRRWRSISTTSAAPASSTSPSPPATSWTPSRECGRAAWSSCPCPRRTTTTSRRASPPSASASESSPASAFSPTATRTATSCRSSPNRSWASTASRASSRRSITFGRPPRSGAFSTAAPPRCAWSRPARSGTVCSGPRRCRRRATRSAEGCR